MRLSYLSVFIFVFLLFNVYAELDYDPIIDWDPIDPVLPSSESSSIISLPPDFTNILGAGMIGITIGILLAALAYMVGNFFMFPQMIGWSKNQLWESIYTMFLVSTVLVFSVAIHLFPLGVPEALEIENYSFPEKAAMTLDKVIRGEVKLAGVNLDEVDEGFLNTENFGVQTHFYGVYAFHLTLNALYGISSFNWDANQIADPKGGVGNTAASGNLSGKTQLFSGLKKLMSLSGLISNYLLTLLMILYVQLSAMVFIAGGAVFFFMFGVFFRCIPFTRKLGSTLIAMFIVLYFIYPAFIIFVFSEGMYDRMNKDFAGDYSHPMWFESMSGFDDKNIVIYSPYGLNQVEDKDFAEGKVILRFSSLMFNEYNYTVTKGFAALDYDLIDAAPEPNDLIENKNNVLCSGTAERGEIIECDLKGSFPSGAHLHDIDDLMEKIWGDEESEVEINPVTYYIQFKANASDYDGDMNYFATVATYPERALPYPVFYSTKCNSEACDQRAIQLSNYLEDFAKEVITYHTLGVLVEDSLGDFLSKEEIYADAASVTMKVVATHTAQKSIKAGISKMGMHTMRSALRKGVPKLAVKGATIAGKALFAAPAILIESLFLKNDISSFTYDSMTCDYYSSKVAEQYFGGINSPEPELSTESGSYMGKLFEWVVNTATPFTAKMLVEIVEGFTKYYSQSDYTSCTGSIGLFNYLADKGLSYVGVTEGQGLSNFHITVLFAPIVYVFISFIYTLIFCVTFFKSLSGSIGGDSSLMGLGKLL